MLNYLLAPVVPKTFGSWAGEVMRSPAPELLRGSPMLMLALLNSLTSTHRYSVATLSFAPTDIDVDVFNSRDITLRTKIDQLIDLFYETAFVGVPKTQRPALLVGTHTHVGRLEINIVVPRYVVKMNGQIRSYSPCVPRRNNRALWNAFQDLANAQFRMADPRDPRRRRVIALTDRHYKHFREAQRQNQKIPLDDTIAIGFAAGAIYREGPAPAGRSDLLRRLRPILEKRGVSVLRGGTSDVTFASGGLEEPRPPDIWTLRGDWMTSDSRRREMRARAANYAHYSSLPQAKLRYRLCAAKWAMVNARRYGFPVDHELAIETLLRSLAKALRCANERQWAWCLVERVFAPATVILQNSWQEVGRERRLVNTAQRQSANRASRYSAGQIGGAHGASWAASDNAGATGAADTCSDNYGVPSGISADCGFHRREHGSDGGDRPDGRGTYPTATSCSADKREPAGTGRGHGEVGKDARSPFGRSRLSLFARLIAEARRYNMRISGLHSVIRSDGRFAVRFKLDGASHDYTGGDLRDFIISDPTGEIAFAPRI